MGRSQSRAHGAIAIIIGACIIILLISYTDTLDSSVLGPQWWDHTTASRTSSTTGRKLAGSCHKLLSTVTYSIMYRYQSILWSDIATNIVVCVYCDFFSYVSSTRGHFLCLIVWPYVYVSDNVIWWFSAYGWRECARRKDFASLEIWRFPPCFVWISFCTWPEVFYTAPGARWSAQVSERTVSVLTKCVSFYARAPPLSHLDHLLGGMFYM